jgi:hypothetical protein
MKITKFEPRVTKLNSLGKVDKHAAGDRGYGWRNTKKARIYVSPQGETVLENLMGGRFTRPHQAYKALVLPLIRELYGQDLKLAWSQRAGCSCPCSPGFVASRPIIVKGGAIEDIWIDVA